jgi:hypothetical protein
LNGSLSCTTFRMQMASADLLTQIVQHDFHTLPNRREHDWSLGH